MSEALLRFTFGPIQSFIAEARRTSDLAVGSHILAELARAAIDALQRGGAELVYPAQLDRGDPPNVLVARVRWEDAERLARQAAHALQARWHGFADGAWQKLTSLVEPDEALRERWNRQIADVWEIYWAAARIDGDDYATAYRRADAGVAALKKTRVFAQRPEPGAKDSLGGNRAALARRNEDPRDFWKSVRCRPAGARLIGEYERLDAVNAVKRFTDLEATFPSVPTIAARPFARLAAARAPQALEAYRDAFELLVAALGERPERYRRTGLAVDQFPYDGAFLYDTTLEWLALIEELGLDPEEAEQLRPKSESALRHARARLADLYHAVGQRPSRYVAVVVLDGDSMGGWLRGALAAGGEPAHREISRLLADFAAEIEQTGREPAPDAQYIYRGGDDVLALVPAEQAIPLVLALAGAFHERTQGRTASAGIAIGHWLEPLGDLLQRAREAEKRAKRLPRKDAIAVELAPRGGEIVHAVAKREQLVALNLPDLIDRFRRKGPGSLSGRLPTDLRELSRAFPEASPAFRAVVARAVQRQGEWSGGTTAERDEVIARLYAFAERFDRVLRERDEDEPRASAERLGAEVASGQSGRVDELATGPAQLASWLALARFLARGGGE